MACIVSLAWRTPRQGRSGVILSAGLYFRQAILIQAHAHLDRLAAHLTVFDVILLASRIINEYRDDLAAIRALNVGGR
jgi:hypothetical protein